MNRNTIKCPNCNSTIDIEEILKHQLEEKLVKEHQSKLQIELDKISKEKEQLNSEKLKMEEFKKHENEIYQKKIDELRKKIAQEEEERAKNKTNQALQELSEKIHKAESENLKLQQKELELLRNEELMKQKYELELKKQLIDEQEKISVQIRKEEQEKIQLERKQLEKKLEDQMKMVEEMQRKASQGSMQMQGEVLEITIEELLKKQFPHDEIVEVQKGVKGADIIHIIKHKEKKCGSIIIECKNTQSFSPEWISKLKDNQKDAQADVAIIVTKTFPKDISSFSFIDGVWVCSLAEFLSLSIALRMQIVKISEVEKLQQNKGDKSIEMYDYLVSDSFKHSVQLIINSYVKMKEEIEREKRFFEKNWKSRELQLNRMIHNTTDFYANIQSIGGSEAINLPYFEAEDEDALEIDY